MLEDYIFQQQIVEIHPFDEVAGQKAHMVELRKVEDVRFQQHGRGGIQLAADVEQVLQKMRIGQLFFVVFVHELPLYFALFHDLRPDFEHIFFAARGAPFRCFLFRVYRKFRKK